MSNLNSTDNTLNFSEVANELLSKLYENYKGNLLENRLPVEEALTEAIQKLDSLLDYTKVVENTSSHYRTENGWNSVLYERRSNTLDEELFQVCSEILSLLRSKAVLDQDLVVYSETSDGGLKISYGKESNLPNAKVRGEGAEAEILYAIRDLKSIKAKKNSNFVNHYNNFKRIALGELKRTKSLSEKFANNKFNMGHVIEAYQRHLFYMENIKKIDEEVIENFVPCNNMTSKNVIINLWYSINSDPWFVGGDVGDLQIKGNNRKLASVLSVREVASKLLYWVHNSTNFNSEDFNKMFNDPMKETFEEVLKEVGNKTLKQLVKEIGQKS